MTATARPYHHGNLRPALLGAAERALARGRELSLRELAREIGVSHAAPRRHFADKQALLDALALDGFERLGGEWPPRSSRPSPRSPTGSARSRAPTCASRPSTARCWI